MRFSAFALSLLLLVSCVTAPAPAPAPAPVAAAPAAAPDCKFTLPLLNATLWSQSAAEYDAVAMQTYAAARRMLDVALSDPTWTAALEQPSADPTLPAAVVLDLDETAIDNSAYQARQVRDNAAFTEETWGGFVNEAISGAVPGAVEFLQYAKLRNVTPFYISNRRGEQEAATRRNLERLGIPLDANVDTVLLRGEREEWKSGEKGPRRAWVASRYRVLLVLGDDLNDFVAASGKSGAERDEIMRKNADRWGTRWFMIPNPMYGSWERASLANAQGIKDDCDMMQRKVEALRTK